MPTHLKNGKRLTWRQAHELGCLVRGNVPSNDISIYARVGRDGYGTFEIREEDGIAGLKCCDGYERFKVASDYLDAPVHEYFTIFMPLK